MIVSRRSIRSAIVVGAVLLAAIAAAAPVPAAADAPPPDWTLSDQELFEVVAAESTKSTVGHERSVQAGPVDHSDADDPGPEPFPSPQRDRSGNLSPSHNRVSSKAPAPQAAPRSSSPVPLRL